MAAISRYARAFRIIGRLLGNFSTDVITFLITGGMRVSIARVSALTIFLREVPALYICFAVNLSFSPVWPARQLQTNHI